MTQKQREEIESIYWDITRSERKLAAIVSMEEKKWSNLGDGSGVLLEYAPVGKKIDSESINLDVAIRSLRIVLESLQISISCLAETKVAIEDLRPKK